MTVSAFPLQWPQGWKRTAVDDRARAKFGRQTQSTVGSWKTKTSLTIAQALERVRGELRTMSIHPDDLVISTNLQLKLDGFPRSAQTEPRDPGAAVYWSDRFDPTRPPMCMAIDRYDRVADNLAAIAATLEAMRSIERHGGAEILKRSFQGFTAIEAPAGEHWSDILDCDRNASTSDVRRAFMVARSKAHPDKDGKPGQFEKVVKAYQQFCIDHGVDE